MSDPEGATFSKFNPRRHVMTESEWRKVHDTHKIVEFRHGRTDMLDCLNCEERFIVRQTEA